MSEAYHTDYDNGDSHSSLELFRESPSKYAAIRVFRTMQPDQPTAAMKEGKALHAILFEYDKECRFAIRARKRPPNWSRFFGDQYSLAVSKTLLSEAQVRLVFGMVKELFLAPDAWNLLVQQQGVNEAVFTTIDKEIGLPLKCKPDRVLRNGIVVDLKTVAGSVAPEDWSKKLLACGYHRQAALYLDIRNDVLPAVDLFVFVAISKDAPEEIGMYVIDDESIEQGRRENRELLERLAECRRTGIWKHEWQGKILTVGVPRWAIKK